MMSGAGTAASEYLGPEHTVVGGGFYRVMG